jgi:hypothetical protein
MLNAVEALRASGLKFENLSQRLYKSEDAISCLTHRPIPVLILGPAARQSWLPACCSSLWRWL